MLRNSVSYPSSGSSSNKSWKARHWPKLASNVLITKREDSDFIIPAKFCRYYQLEFVQSCLRGLTTAKIASGPITAFKSFQNSAVKICSGTPPPEKQSCTTISYRVSLLPAVMLADLPATHPLASSRKTLPFPGSGRPKYVRAARYTAGSISTMVVEIPCRMKEVAETPVPNPLSRDVR